MVPKTMAILGDTGKFSRELVNTLAQLDLLLLFVSENEVLKDNLKREFCDINAAAEIDFTGCEKEGCWEADMILLFQPDATLNSHLDRIRDVSTQKIVLVISQGIPHKPEDLEELLPNSRIVEVNINMPLQKIALCSADAEAKREVQTLFAPLGYQIN